MKAFPVEVDSVRILEPLVLGPLHGDGAAGAAHAHGEAAARAEVGAGAVRRASMRQCGGLRGQLVAASSEAAARHC